MQTDQLLLSASLIPAIATVTSIFVFAKNYGFSKQLSREEKFRKIVVERDILFCGLLTISLGIYGLGSYEKNPDILEITTIVLFSVFSLCLPAYLAGIYKRKWISI